MGVIAGNLALTVLWNVSTYFPYEILPHNNINTTTMTKNYTYDTTAVSKGDFSSLSMPMIYEYAALKYPKQKFSQFSTAYDWNQAFFLKAMKDGGAATLQDKYNWNAAMKVLYDPNGPLSKVNNYREFIAEGDYHCVIWTNRYWKTYGYDKKLLASTNRQKIYLDNWIQNMLLTDKMSKHSVGCIGADCLVELDVIGAEERDILPSNFFG